MWQALLKYFLVKNPPAALPTKVPSLSVIELQAANSSVQKTIEQKSISNSRGKYNHYMAEERAMIGKYAAENGPTHAFKHFS